MTRTVGAGRKQPDDRRADGNVDTMHGVARQKYQTIYRLSKDTTSGGT